jgi:hypothetical protein
LTSVKRTAGGRGNIARNIMNRSLRRIVAWLGILGIALAQLVAAANACELVTATGHERHPVAPSGAATVVAGHCGDHLGGPVAPATNLCEVHCSDGATPVTTVDLPPVVQVPMPVPALSLAALAAVDSPPALHPAPHSAGPPIVLRYGHLLI